MQISDTSSSTFGTDKHSFMAPTGTTELTKMTFAASQQKFDFNNYKTNSGQTKQSWQTLIHTGNENKLTSQTLSYISIKYTVLPSTLPHTAIYSLHPRAEIHQSDPSQQPKVM